tara:strand:- start:485 stop:940 length:456 start_codon:yes stop_codon:yes gene_type:complete
VIILQKPRFITSITIHGDISITVGPLIEDFLILFTILFGEAFTVVVFSVVVLETFITDGVSIIMLPFMDMVFLMDMAIPLDLDITTNMPTMAIIEDIHALAPQEVIMFIQNRILPGGDDPLVLHLIMNQIEIKLTQVITSKEILQITNVTM